MFASFLFHLFFAAIPLSGVTGEFLQSRAFFDANNVKVGDPLILNIDFFGAADFASLHPPALSKSISRTDWKIDDASAKTDTYQDPYRRATVGRRLTYRVRPMRDGVLYFPALDFTYLDGTGLTRRVSSNPIPVHAKKSSNIVVAGMAEHDEIALPEPPPLITTFETTDPDLDFAWRKACAAPTTNAFAAFDFPAAKLNEARLATLAGDWQHALKIYSRLEWQIGQTPEIERGIIAALARRTSNPLVELPVWRQVGRPILRYTWLGRTVILSAALFILALLYLLLRRILRALAALALICAFTLPSHAQGFDPFKMIEEAQQQMQQIGQQAFSGGGFTFNLGGEEPLPITNLVATVQPSKSSPQVGENFELIFSLELPKCLGIVGGLRPEFTDPPPPFMRTAKRLDELTSLSAANPSNIIKRLSLSVRFDAPFNDELHFNLKVPLQYRIERKTKNSSFVSTQMTLKDVPLAPLKLTIAPLPSVHQPADFSGIVATNLQLSEKIDPHQVETNDVVSIYYTLTTDGYIPSSWTPTPDAFIWTPDTWRRYFVATGEATTPTLCVCWYDPEKKEYRRQTIGGTPLTYIPTP